MTVKQLGFACCQVVQKPFGLSFHLPVFFCPDCARGSRVILPSGINVILNLVPPGVEAVKGWPLKKVAWRSLGVIGSAAKAALPVRSMHTTANVPARIKRTSLGEASPLPAIRGQQRVQAGVWKGNVRSTCAKFSRARSWLITAAMPTQSI